MPILDKFLLSTHIIIETLFEKFKSEMDSNIQDPDPL